MISVTPLGSCRIPQEAGSRSELMAHGSVAIHVFSLLCGKNTHSDSAVVAVESNDGMAGNNMYKTREFTPLYYLPPPRCTHIFIGKPTKVTYCNAYFNRQTNQSVGYFERGRHDLRQKSFIGIFTEVRRQSLSVSICHNSVLLTCFQLQRSSIVYSTGAAVFP